MRDECGALVDALDRIDEAVMLIGADGVLVHANELAASLLRRGVGLSLSRGCIAIANAAARAAFARALEACAACSPASDEGLRQVERIVIPRRGDHPMVLTIYGASRAAPGRSQATLAIAFVHDPVRRYAERVSALQLAYRFTPSEMRLVRALNDGLTLREFSAQTGLSYETVRSYMRRVLGKAGARSQADIVRLTRGLL